MIGRCFWLCVALICYTYAGYPLLLAALARLRRPRSYPAAEPPPLTLLIAAYNEQDVIAEKLENSLALNYPRHLLQVLVAADGSDDRTAEIVRGYAERGVELSYSPERHGKMAAINRAMRLARGEIVVFSDANNSYEPQVLRRLVQPFADPAVGATTGAKLIVKGDGLLGDSEGLYWRYESFIKRQETRLGCCTGVAGEILAIRRDLFEPAPESVINDDFYLAMRLVKRGYNVAYVPEARSSERVSPTARDEIARRSRIVAGRYQALAQAHRLLPLDRPLLSWQIVSHKFLRPLVPLAMAGALTFNLLAVLRPSRGGSRWLALTPPAGPLMLALQAMFYGMAWLGGRSEHSGRLGKLLYLPAFLVNSNLAAVIGLYRYLRGRQSTRWQRVARRPEQPAAHAERGAATGRREG